jgi:hypothetical protein
MDTTLKISVENVLDFLKNIPQIINFSLSCKGRYPVCQVFISTTQTRKPDALAG